MTQKIQTIKQLARDRLGSVEREGMKELIQYMNEKGFFEAPASTRWHGVYNGGLVVHSHLIFELLSRKVLEFDLKFPVDSMIICSYGHDLCKAGAYLSDGCGGYIWNNNNGKGHALLSIQRLKRFIELKPEEEEIIRYHMGFYGTREFGRYGEYSLHELTEAYNKLKIAKLFYFCDDMATQFLEKE